MANLDEIIKQLIDIRNQINDENTYFGVILDGEPFYLERIVGIKLSDDQKLCAIEVSITEKMRQDAFKKIVEQIKKSKESTDDLIEKQA